MFKNKTVILVALLATLFVIAPFTMVALDSKAIGVSVYNPLPGAIYSCKDMPFGYCYGSRGCSGEYVSMDTNCLITCRTNSTVVYVQCSKRLIDIPIEEKPGPISDL